jgi:hypothetical protein
MRKIIIFTLLIFTCYSCLPVQANDIWGVWNPGQPSNNIQNHITRDGIYEIDQLKNYIILISDYNSKGPQMLFPGGNYLITKIIKNENNVVSLYISAYVVEPSSSEWMQFYAKININFINENQMWIEIDYNDSEYPTPQWFNPFLFPGSNLIYWRQREKGT